MASVGCGADADFVHRQGTICPQRHIQVSATPGEFNGLLKCRGSKLSRAVFRSDV